jgi:hypothetical protein
VEKKVFIVYHFKNLSSSGVSGMKVKRNALFFNGTALFFAIAIYAISPNGLAQTNLVNVAIQGVEAKKLFSYLTGPKVKSDAAMSKKYLQGANVVCQYVTALITNHGINVPMGDPSRYSCMINFDYNGLAAPSMPL